jgi:hypothetical protein
VQEQRRELGREDTKAVPIKDLDFGFGFLPVLSEMGEIREFRCFSVKFSDEIRFFRAKFKSLVPISMPEGGKLPVSQPHLGQGPIRRQPLVDDLGDEGGGRGRVAEVATRLAVKPVRTNNPTYEICHLTKKDPCN